MTEISACQGEHDAARRDERKQLYRTWYGMRRRCQDERTEGYKYYGGRGIKVCQRWDESFDAFAQDVGARPQGTSLDRINPDGDYEPENCRWATARTQRLNQRCVKLYELDGVSRPLSDWANDNGMHIATLYNRITRGIPLKIAIAPIPSGLRIRGRAGNAGRWSKTAIRKGEE